MPTEKPVLLASRPNHIIFLLLTALFFSASLAAADPQGVEAADPDERADAAEQLVEPESKAGAKADSAADSSEQAVPLSERERMRQELMEMAEELGDDEQSDEKCRPLRDEQEEVRREIVDRDPRRDALRDPQRSQHADAREARPPDERHHDRADRQSTCSPAIHDDRGDGVERHPHRRRERQPDDPEHRVEHNVHRERQEHGHARHDHRRDGALSRVEPPHRHRLRRP